jgi:hypothetical protein
MSPPTPSAKSDSLGRFVCGDIRPGAVYLTATHASFCESERVKLTLDPGATTEVELHMAAGGTIVGSVDPSLGPTSARLVSLFSFRGTIGWRETETDEHGTFAFDHVIPQAYVIELRPYGYPDDPPEAAHTGVRKNIRVEEGQVTEVVFGAATQRILVSGSSCAGGPWGPDQGHPGPVPRTAGRRPRPEGGQYGAGALRPGVSFVIRSDADPGAFRAQHPRRGCRLLY